MTGMRMDSQHGTPRRPCSFRLLGWMGFMPCSNFPRRHPIGPVRIAVVLGGFLVPVALAVFSSEAYGQQSIPASGNTPAPVPAAAVPERPGVNRGTVLQLLLR